MKHVHTGALLLAALPLHAAFALEALKPYDSFGSTTIDGTRWTHGEHVLQSKGGVLRIVQRDYGLDTTSTGQFSGLFGTNVQEPATVTELEATITVNALEVDTCATNTALAQSRARIIGSFYNIGTPVAGSEVGDAISQVRLVRQSTSVDPPGVLQVQALLLDCTNVDCSTSNLVQLVSLGPVNVGQSAVVEMQWDHANHRFLYARDGGVYTGTITYTDSDAQPPGLPFKGLQARVDIDHCAGTVPPTGYVDASFDAVKVNKSALP